MIIQCLWIMLTFFLACLHRKVRCQGHIRFNVYLCDDDLFLCIEYTVQSESCYAPICVFSCDRRWFTEAIFPAAACVCEGEAIVGTVCLSPGMCEHACCSPTSTVHHNFCVGFWVSLHMQVRIRSIKHCPARLMKCGRRAKHTSNTLNLHTVWMHDLWARWARCPRVAGIIFLVLTGPAWRFGPLRDEGKESPDFLTLENIKQTRMSSSFSLWWSWDGVS